MPWVVDKKSIKIKEIMPHRCIGCGVCVQSCMNDVIRMKQGKATIAYQEDCSQCFACVIDCPRDAISLGWVER
ncbi:MAG: 4Fe-4S dicluster domain-containing protein [Dehalococcoidia bacterium]|nr:4Fe-4S dicluster domain-containing protein [Dehalococcoidia bacterium]